MKKTLQRQRLPHEWRFVPIRKGSKAPIGRDWQKKPLQWTDVKDIPETKVFRGVHAGGIGVLCGPVSDGLLMFDHDGHSCDDLIETFSGLPLSEALPKTVKVTSGRDGRYQLAYRVPEKYWDGIANKDYPTGVTGDDGKPEQIEFRWKGRQSVIIGEHPITGGYRWVHSPADTPIAEAPLWMIEKMLKPEFTPANTQPKSHQWTDQQWALSYLEAINPEPLDWYTWRNVLLGAHAAGLNEDQVRQWSQRSSQHTDKGFSDVWRHIKGKSDGVGLGTLGYLAKKDGWASPFSSSGESKRKLKASNTSGDIGNFKVSKETTATLTPEDLSKHLQRLISEDVAPSDIAKEIPQLAKQVDWYTSDVRKLYESLQQRQEQDDEIACSEISELVAIARQEINLHDFLPPAIARALHSKADSDRLDPIRPLQTFLASSASQLGSRLAIELKGSGRDAWVEYPILWMLDIDCPSSGKSQSDRAIAAPLRSWQKAEDRRLKDALKRLPELEKAWDKLCPSDQAKLAGSDQDPSVLRADIDNSRTYVFPKGTLEALLNRLSEQPARAGMCWLPDEVSGLIKGVDAYKKGGDGENIILSSWNGPIFEAMGRASKQNTIFFEGQTLCISGGTQPDRVIDLLDPDRDSSGMGSRWLMAMPKLHDEVDVWSDLNVDCYGALEQLYSNLNSLNANAEETLRVKLSKDAKTLFTEHWQEYRRKYKELREENSGLAYFLGKCPGHLGRLALTLHSIDVACGVGHLEVISADCMRRAAKLLSYYIGQFRLIQIHAGGGHDLDKRQLWAANLLKAKGLITAQQLMKLNNKKKGTKRITTADGRMLLAKLAEVGLGRLTDKNTLEAIQATPTLEETSEAIEPGKNEALPDHIKTDTPVEVTYPIGVTPPPGALPPGTRGTVTAINGDNITILIPPPTDTPDIPLGRRFRTVPRKHLSVCSLTAVAN